MLIEYDFPPGGGEIGRTAGVTHGSFPTLFAPRKVKAAHRRLLLVALDVDSLLYHGKFIQFSRGGL